MIDKDHRWADGARDLLQLRARRLILVRHPKLDEPSLRRLQEEAARAWRNVVRYPPLSTDTDYRYTPIFTARGSCVLCILYCPLYTKSGHLVYSV